MSRIAWDALVSQVAQIFRSDTLMLGWECGDVGILRLDYKRCGISCGNLWILQFPFGADHDSLRLDSYFNFFHPMVKLSFADFLVCSFWQFGSFGHFAGNIWPSSRLATRQAWSHDWWRNRIVKRERLSPKYSAGSCYPVSSGHACKRWCSVFDLGIFDRCWRCRIWRNRRWVDGWLCLFRGLE